MKTVKDMFGAGAGASIDLAWNGREEDFSSTAARLSASLVRLTELTGLQWHYDTADLQSRSAAFATVPSDPEAIAGILRQNQDQDWGFTACTFSALLSAGPGTGAPTPAQIHIASGSPLDSWNRMNLDLSDDFPLGTVTDAAALFSDLVRIWQPDHAQLGTRAMYAALPTTRAAFMSWTSAKAYTEPESDGEICVPFGDGTLRVARDWTVEAVLKLDTELKAAGAPQADNSPKTQDPPQFPSESPDLTELASL